MPNRRVYHAYDIREESDIRLQLMTLFRHPSGPEDEDPAKWPPIVRVAFILFIDLVLWAIIILGIDRLIHHFF